VDNFRHPLALPSINIAPIEIERGVLAGSAHWLEVAVLDQASVGRGEPPGRHRHAPTRHRRNPSPYFLCSVESRFRVGKFIGRDWKQRILRPSSDSSCPHQASDPDNGDDEPDEDK
jgi:hypothetical protein